MIYKLIILISLHYCNSEWVEIPQSSISSSIEKTPRKSDISIFYSLTTTTAQTPILARPAVIKVKPNRRKSNPDTRDFENNRRNKNNNKLIQQAQDRVSTKSNKVRVVNNVSNIRVHNQGRIANSFPDIEDWEDAHIEDDENIDEIYYGIPNTFNTSEKFSNNEEPEEQAEQVDDGYNYASFVPYLNKVQSTLMRNAHNTKKSKVSILTNLRDNLLYQLENRINSIWRPKSSGTEARGDSGWSDSGVDFPSNEAALMTIGFLTFAVFLIKLVLKLVQHISNNGTTSGTVFGRRRRDAIDSDSIKILNLIDEYSFK